jgi:hypothetical protein
MRIDWQAVDNFIEAVLERCLLRREDAVFEHAGID